jgi:hypothetical protein
MEFYSATKKNESLPFAGKWMELENIILSEAKPHMFSLTCRIETQYKYKQYYIYIEICTEHVFKSELAEKTKREGKEGKKDNDLS